MARCAHKPCGRWRPRLLVRLAGLGLCLDDAWYCSAPCLGAAVRERLAQTPPVVAPVMPAAAQPRLGGVLAMQKRLAPGVVERAVSVQARTGLRIGTQLIELGLVTKLDVLRALAAQSGIGFLAALDPARLTSAPGNLSPAVVRALGVVPFEADRKHDVLKVAVTAPVPRNALAALRQLTGSIIEPYLVGDDQWPAVVQAYGASSRGGAPAPTPMVDLESLSARVTAAARRAGAIRMSEARCDDHLWVRLDAGGQVEELVMTPSRGASRMPPAAVNAPATPVVPPGPEVAPVAVAPRPKRVRTARAAATRPRAGRPRASGARAPSAAAAPAAAPARVDERVDLSFLEAWDSRDVPLFER